MDSKTPMCEANEFFSFSEDEHGNERAELVVTSNFAKELETLANELAGALEWALSMTNPSPCRCISFAKPPNVCKGHSALARFNAMREEAK